MRYRIFRRGRIYYSEDKESGKQESLRTRDKAEAQRLLQATNEAARQSALNFQIGRVYLMASDPESANRTWQQVMDEMGKVKRGATAERWERAMREKPFGIIRNQKLIETRAQHFLSVLNAGTVSTNIFLRRLHNFALDMSWLPVPLIPRRQWPSIEFRDKRAITPEEHQKILAGESNAEWHAYYSLLWHFGGSQSDIASLIAEDIDWTDQVVSFRRMKTGARVQLHFGKTVETLLRKLPNNGLLFPRIAKMKESDRAKAFIRRCKLVGVSGVSLHCYRYAWAERARTCGYPERFAQEALGHNSKAVHRAYAKKAQVKLPSLDEYEKKILPIEFGGNEAKFARAKR